MNQGCGDQAQVEEAGGGRKCGARRSCVEFSSCGVGEEGGEPRENFLDSGAGAEHALHHQSVGELDAKHGVTVSGENGKFNLERKRNIIKLVPLVPSFPLAPLVPLVPLAPLVPLI